MFFLLSKTAVGPRHWTARVGRASTCIRRWLDWWSIDRGPGKEKERDSCEETDGNDVPREQGLLSGLREEKAGSEEKTSSVATKTAEADSIFLSTLPPSLPASRPGDATIPIHS
jgi:hypothetical protein